MAEQVLFISPHFLLYAIICKCRLYLFCIMFLYRHNVTWWKTRCYALEYENHVLKTSIKNLMQNQNRSHNSSGRSQSAKQHNLEDIESDNDDENNEDENLEFHLDENMMDFLAQSIRHKIELKNKKESEEIAEENKESSEEKAEGGLVWVHKRNEDAKLLYGPASPRILAMETALKTTIERHLDKAKPQYWPNIPLKL